MMCCQIYLQGYNTWAKTNIADGIDYLNSGKGGMLKIDGRIFQLYCQFHILTWNDLGL